MYGKKKAFQGERKKRTAGAAKKVLQFLAGLGIAVLFSLPYFFMRNEITRFPALGYIGVMLGCALSNASLFLPTSSTLIVLSAATVLHPAMCVVAGGAGAAAGEQVSYICGRVGLAWVRPDGRREWKIVKWMERNSALTVFIFAFLPLPLFDFVGIAAGAKKMKWIVFAAAAAAGKVLKFALFAFAVLYFIPRYIGFLPENIRSVYEAYLAGITSF